MNFDEIVDAVENSFVSDNLLGSINPQVEALLKESEIGLEAIVHDEIIDLLVVMRVEVLAGLANLHVIESTHDVA